MNCKINLDMQWNPVFQHLACRYKINKRNHAPHLASVLIII